MWLQFPCPLCQRIAKSELCHDCERNLRSYQLKDQGNFWRGEYPLFAWGKYDGDLSRAIATLKYENHPELGILLGKWLGTSWLNSNPIKNTTQPIIVPIPLHQSKLKTRGFNQAELIAQGFCQVTKYKLIADGLIRTKATEAMFGLKRDQRQININNAFQLNERLKQKPPRSPILIIDDIYTSGTTVKEATRTLTKHKLKVIGAATVSRVTTKKIEPTKSKNRISK